MPDVLGEILRRLDALEGAVHGRASQFFDRKLSKVQVAIRVWLDLCRFGRAKQSANTFNLVHLKL
jgi:hypothetical protein